MASIFEHLFADDLADQVRIEKEEAERAKRQAIAEPIKAAWLAFDDSQTNLYPHIVGDDGKPHDVQAALKQSIRLFTNLHKAIEASGLDLLPLLVPRESNGTDVKAIGILKAPRSNIKALLTKSLTLTNHGPNGMLGEINCVMKGGLQQQAESLLNLYVFTGSMEPTLQRPPGTPMAQAATKPPRRRSRQKRHLNTRVHELILEGHDDKEIHAMLKNEGISRTVKTINAIRNGTR